MNPSTQNNPQNFVQNDKKVSNIALALFAALFVLPIIVATIGTLASSPESRQYGLFLFIFIGLYNFPAVGISGLSVVIGKLIESKSSKVAVVLYTVSILASVVGILITGVWLISGILS